MKIIEHESPQKFVQFYTEQLNEIADKMKKYKVGETDAKDLIAEVPVAYLREYSDTEKLRITLLSKPVSIGTEWPYWIINAFFEKALMDIWDVLAEKSKYPSEREVSEILAKDSIMGAILTASLRDFPRRPSGGELEKPVAA